MLKPHLYLIFSLGLPSQPTSQQTQWQSSLAIKLSDLSCSHLSLCITPSVCVMCKRVYNKYLCFILQYDGDVDDVLFYFYFCWFWWLKICLHRTLCIMRCATDCWNSNISPHANSSLHWNTVYKWMNVFHRCKFELLLLLLSIIMLSIWSFYLLIRWCSGNNLNWIEYDARKLLLFILLPFLLSKNMIPNWNCHAQRKRDINKFIHTLFSVCEKLARFISLMLAEVCCCCWGA